MTKLTVARWISLVGHPFVLAVFLALTPLWTTGQASAALRVTLVVLVVAVVPLTLFVRRRYATGQWSTVDASSPADRPALFRASFAALLPLAFYFHFVEHSSTQTRGTAFVLALMAVAAVLNSRIKLSLHLAFATFGAFAVIPLGPAHAVPLFLFLPLLAWSRLALSRHTSAELVAGLFLGTVFGLLMLY